MRLTSLVFFPDLVDNKGVHVIRESADVMALVEFWGWLTYTSPMYILAECRRAYGEAFRNHMLTIGSVRPDIKDTYNIFEQVSGMVT